MVYCFYACLFLITSSLSVICDEGSLDVPNLSSYVINNRAVRSSSPGDYSTELTKSFVTDEELGLETLISDEQRKEVETLTTDGDSSYEVSKKGHVVDKRQMLVSASDLEEDEGDEIESTSTTATTPTAKPSNRRVNSKFQRTHDLSYSSSDELHPQDVVKHDEEESEDPDLIDGHHVDITDTFFNETLKNQHAEFNQSSSVNLRYYSYESTPFDSVWIDLDARNESIHSELGLRTNFTSPPYVIEHDLLSGSHRRADTISMSFDFPFYGHLVRNVTIATGGFLYTGEYVHSWLAATQYIAPLMANFDTSQDQHAKIRYSDNGTSLTVEWLNVRLVGKENSTNQTYTQGPFTFQATLHANGEICFAYKSIPVDIKSITDEQHPVKVGLSDAYILERTIFFVRRKTIYEYHRLNLKDEIVVRSGSAIHFKSLDSCNKRRDCFACLGTQNSNPLGCKWCPSINQCSDGTDRNKQKWIEHQCELKFVDHIYTCQHIFNTLLSSKTKQVVVTNDTKNTNATIENDRTTVQISSTSSSTSKIITEKDGNADPFNTKQDFDIEHDPFWDKNPVENDAFFSDKSDLKVENNSNVTSIVFSVLLVIIVSCICWIGYAYFFPHTTSGQILIRYRPSRWHFLRGSGSGSGGHSYTAATSIHM